MEFIESYRVPEEGSVGPGVSQYTSCVHGHASDTSLGQFPSSSRYNNSRIYTSGPRQGQERAVKWLTSGAVFLNTYYTLDIKTVNKSLEIVNKFNQSNIINKAIKRSSKQWSGQRHLYEPFIQNYPSSNSNTRWNDSSIAWGEAMQALSHISYHITGGNHILVTDLGSGGISLFFSQHSCSAYCHPDLTKPAKPIHFLASLCYCLPTSFINTIIIT
ncbi:kinase-like domain-containing protein [Trichoderma ceciliae]